MWWRRRRVKEDKRAVKSLSACFADDGVGKVGFDEDWGFGSGYRVRITEKNAG